MVSFTIGGVTIIGTNSKRHSRKMKSKRISHIDTQKIRGRPQPSASTSTSTSTSATLLGTRAKNLPKSSRHHHKPPHRREVAVANLLRHTSSAKGIRSRVCMMDRKRHSRCGFLSCTSGGSMNGTEEPISISSTSMKKGSVELEEISVSENVSEDFTKIFTSTVLRAVDGSEVVLGEIMPELSTGRTVVILLTHFADFDSWELGKGLVDWNNEFKEKDVRLIAIGIGSSEAAKLFSDMTSFPIECLFSDPLANLHKSLELSAGFGREGGLFGSNSFVSDLPGLVKLLIMCAGVGSPGTLQEVIRGYIGDTSREKVFQKGMNNDIPWRSFFDIVGKNYQRPFELATLRLLNMISIIPKFSTLGPADSNLLVQRGGAYVFQDGITKYKHKDLGILGFIPAKKLAQRATAMEPSEPFMINDVLHDAGKRQAWPEDVYKAMLKCEKVPAKKNGVEIETINGQWKLQFTGPKVVKNKNATTDSEFGSYFPLEARQSFNAISKTIRNGVYIADGRVASLYFDGIFDWSAEKKILEFVFESVSLTLGNRGPFQLKLDGSTWNKAKKVEETIVKGEGSIERATPGKPFSNPFFKFVFADDQVIVARGRGGGLALWTRIDTMPVKTD